MATYSQIKCDLCGDAEETEGGRVPSIRAVTFQVGYHNALRDLICRAPDLCEDCRIKTVGAIKRLLKMED